METRCRSEFRITRQVHVSKTGATLPLKTGMAVRSPALGRGGDKGSASLSKAGACFLVMAHRFAGGLRFLFGKTHRKNHTRVVTIQHNQYAAGLSRFGEAKANCAEELPRVHPCHPEIVAQRLAGTRPARELRYG